MFSYRRFLIFLVFKFTKERECIYDYVTPKNLFEVDFPVCVWGVLVAIISSIQYEGGAIN